MEPEHSEKTVLVVTQQLLKEFEDYSDVADEVEELIDDLGGRGSIQLATFHPKYRFAGQSSGR